jgi:6-oxo-cyclohex-1-ene-carbonyl-CoA hydrolase
VNEIVPVHRTADAGWIPNPMVVTERWTDEMGRIVFGDWKTGEAAAAARTQAAGCTVDLTRLDTAVERLVTQLLHTFPDCTRKTLESLRKKKLEHWFANSESNRSWLALNMNTEAAAGFPAFHFGDRNEREIDFARLRRRLAEGARFDPALVREVLLPSAAAGVDA